MLILASILLDDPDVLILDEPTTHLDSKSTIDLLNLLKKINVEKNKTIILISHYLDNVLFCTNRILFLSEGKLIDDGNVFDVLSNKNKLIKNNLVLPKIKEFKIDSKARSIEELNRELNNGN